MAYRDILVQIDETSPSAARAALAATLAVQHQATVTGVFLKTEFIHTYMAGEGIAYMSPRDITALLERQSATVARLSDAARAIFDQAVRDAGAMSDWRVIDGDSDAEMVAWARRFDLTVFPPSATVSTGRHQISAARLGLASGGPILVAPKADVAVRTGRRILIAWNGSRESARALRDAWPMLGRADSVHVLTASPHRLDEAERQLQPHLDRHDCRAEFIVDRAQNISAAEAIRDQIRRVTADLVVMGLYGHPRLQEMVLGGTSHELLRDPPIPLLVSH